MTKPLFSRMSLPTMPRLGFLFGLTTMLLAALLASGPRSASAQPVGVTVYVQNPLPVDRPDEIVTLVWPSLEALLPELAPERVRVLDSEGAEVPVQVVHADGPLDGEPVELLFLADFRPAQARTFTVEAAPASPTAPRVHVRHDPRRNDIAWENDRIAFRTYGQGLWELESLVSSGFDVWTKRTDDLVLERWYAAGDYHTDRGEGADFYAVGPSLGGGGTAVWQGETLHRAPNFSGYRILANGPIRAMVELDYAPWEAGDLRVSERKRITIDAGHHVFRQENTFHRHDGGGGRSIPYAVGMVARDGFVASQRTDGPWAWLGGWEPLNRAAGGHGELGTAVLIPSERLVAPRAVEGHFVAVAEALPGLAAPTYVAAGWTSSRHFAGVEAWWAYLDGMAARLAHPLRVRLPAAPLDATAALDAAAARIAPFLDHEAHPERIPRAHTPDGRLHVSPTHEWTSGFYPGLLWLLYDHTRDARFEDAARRWTAVVEPEKLNARTHDMGFKIYCSFGTGYRLTGDPHYRDVLVESADTLMTRFNPTVGAIRSWDWGRWSFPVIIDNMMNLELLFAATRLTGDSAYYGVARQHALTTIDHLFRDDASSFHVVDFDPETGEPLRHVTHQGYADASAWSRGQAWALYGFAMTYRETGEELFLEQARRVAEYILAHPNLPADYVPYWDYDAPDIPNEPRDASAAAVAASALYELAGYVPEERSRYVEAADRMLAALSSPAYRAHETTEGPFLLLHSVGSVPGNFEVDSPIVYADYYYAEALLRRLRMEDESAGASQARALAGPRP